MPEKLWMQKMRGLDLTDHHQRLRNSKPRVDSSSPQRAPRGHRLARERERQQQDVEKENRMLLERLARIVQKKTVDNVNKFKSKAMSRDPSKRSKEKKLQRDNKLLLKRLLHAEKSYSTKEWRKQEEWRQGILSRMGVKKPSTTPSVVPSTLLNESHNNPGPSESQRPGSAPAKVFHKKPWQGTAIALNEQDRLHLCREVPPLRAASPIFKKPKKRPSTASVLRSSQVVPVPSDASLCRDREIKKLFKPSGAYMSSKVNGAPSTSRAY